MLKSTKSSWSIITKIFKQFHWHLNVFFPLSDTMDKAEHQSHMFGKNLPINVFIIIILCVFAKILLNYAKAIYLRFKNIYMLPIQNKDSLIMIHFDPGIK